MKTWQKVSATVGAVCVAVAMDVILKENGILLGGLGTLVFYGLVLVLPITIVWKLRSPKKEERIDEDDGSREALARKAKEETKKMGKPPPIPKGIDVLAARLDELNVKKTEVSSSCECSFSKDEIRVLKDIIAEYKSRSANNTQSAVFSDEIRRRNYEYIERKIREMNLNRK